MGSLGKKTNSVTLALEEVDDFLFLAHDDHLLLYDRKFWIAHFKAFWLVLRYNRDLPKKSKMPVKKLKRLPFLIWLKLIPICGIIWAFIFFSLLVWLDLDGEDRNFVFMVNIPPFLLIAWLYHKLANWLVAKYHKRIVSNIELLH